MDYLPNAARRLGQAVSVAPVNEYLTTQQVADLLGVSRPTVVRMLEAGRLPYERVNKHRRIPRLAVEEYMRQRDQLFDASLALSASMGEITETEAIRASKAAREALASESRP